MAPYIILSKRLSVNPHFKSTVIVCIGNPTINTSTIGGRRGRARGTRAAGCRVDRWEFPAALKMLEYSSLILHLLVSKLPRVFRSTYTFFVFISPFLLRRFLPSVFTLATFVDVSLPQ